jgi:hypothetical protein
VPADLIDRHLAAVRAGAHPAIVTGAVPPARLELAFAVAQHGFVVNAMRDAPELSGIGALELLKAPPPPIWAFHGMADSLVDSAVLSLFATRARELHGKEVRLKETYIPGGEHSVGDDMHAEDGWVKEGLDWLKNYWPQEALA